METSSESPLRVGDSIVFGVNYMTEIEQLKQLNRRELDRLRPVAEKFAFKSNDYYLSLIDWDDPDDPIRRIIIPNERELEDWGSLDASNEQAYTVMPGVEHKYDSTVLVLVNNQCDGICRYCFRKRVFMGPREECLNDIDGLVEYLRQHTEVSNVLLTGGDPLTLATRQLRDIISKIRPIDHVRIIRIGTKVPVFNPQRILDDPELIDLISSCSTPRKKVYVITHFMHPRELTDVAVQAITALHRAGAAVNNQCPLIRGVNDDPAVLAELLSTLASVGAIPYYVFQCRPALGNKAYTVPIEEGYTIVERAKTQISGLAKRVKFVMSHTTGKMEIVLMTKDEIFFKYHRSAMDVNSGRVLAFSRDSKACWLDDYDDPIQDFSLDDVDSLKVV